MRYAIVVMLLLALAMPMFAEAPTGGWGHDVTNSVVMTSGSYTTPTVVWDPAASDWYDGTSLGVNYDNIDVKLFVELYMVESYHYTSYTFHRIGNLENDYNTETGQYGEYINFVIEGTLASNNALTCGLTKGPLGEDLSALRFRNDIFGGGSAPDLPITWFYRYGNGFDIDDGVTWTQVALNGAGEVFIPSIPKCDHWFQFKGEVFLPYHLDDGFYSLTIGGCPTPQM